jgi:hypothetical protein
MAQSIIRQIERNLTASVGSNSDQLIRPRSAESIKASGRVTAPKGRTHDCKRPLLITKNLANRGPSTHEAALMQKIPALGARGGDKSREMLERVSETF